MSLFLIKNKTEKAFGDKIVKLSRKTQDSIKASGKLFGEFCLENYDGRNSQDIFNELNTLKDKKRLMH